MKLIYIYKFKFLQNLIKGFLINNIKIWVLIQNEMWRKGNGERGVTTANIFLDNLNQKIVISINNLNIYGIAWNIYYFLK